MVAFRPTEKRLNSRQLTKAGAQLRYLKGNLIQCIITLCMSKIQILLPHHFFLSEKDLQEKRTKFNSTYAVGPKVVNCLYRTSFQMHSFLMDFEVIKK